MLLEAIMGSGRASKKLIVDHDKVPSSVYAVLSNDDLLIEILLRLPAFSILVFKCVSKRWLSLITDNNFTLRCTQNPHVEPPSGFLFQRDMSRFIYDYVPFDIRSSLLDTAFRFGFPCDEGNVEILQSCNGLLLCRIINPHNTYYVYNPSINRFKMLPPCCNYSEFYDRVVMRLAFDPIKSPHYKLVFAGKKYDGGSYIQIQTYSSETGTWSICHDRFPNSSFLYFHHAIYWNNAIQWTFMGNMDIHYKLHVEQLVLTSIQTPVEFDRIWRSKLVESRGCLLFVSEYTLSLKIYEMSKGNSGWSIKYHVNHNDMTRKLQPRAIASCYSVLGIVLGEKEEDSFLVIETCGKVLQFKFMLNTVRELYDYGALHHTITYFSHGFYQFYASFISV